MIQLITANKITLKQTFSSCFIKICSFSGDDSNVKVCGLCSGSWVGWILIHYANDSSVFHFLGANCTPEPSAEGTTMAAEPQKKRTTGYETIFPKGDYHPGLQRDRERITKSLSPHVALLKQRQIVWFSNFIEGEVGRQILPWNIPNLCFGEHLFKTDVRPPRL